jgi:hypothetical protein
MKLGRTRGTVTNNYYYETDYKLDGRDSIEQRKPSNLELTVLISGFHIEKA